MVPTEESRRLFAGKIRTESQRMSKLVEDIIDLSQLDVGGVGMTRENTDLYRIAVNAVESLESTAADASAKPPSRWAVRVTRPFLQRPTAVEVLPTSTTANVRRRSIPG